MTANESTALDQILALADFAGTRRARDLLQTIRNAVEHGADVVPWVSAVQLARSLGAITDTAAYYLIHLLTEEAMLRRSDTDDVLVGLRNAMEVIERANGLEDGEYWRTYEAPTDWQALNRKWEQRCDVIHAQMLRALDEHEIANDLLLRPDACHRRSEEGRRSLMEFSDFGP